jgi:hypothetical protein
VKWFKAEQAILNERGIIVDPGLAGPVQIGYLSPFGRDKTYTTGQSDRLNARIGSVLGLARQFDLEARLVIEQPN